MELCAGHCGITGNELADRKPKEASGLNTTGRPVSLPRAVSCIIQNILDPEIQRSRTAAVYADHSEQRDRRETASRKDSTLLAQLRSGHCIRLQAYKHLMDNTVDPNCPRCGQAHRRRNTGSTALALYAHDWRFSVPLKHFLCSTLSTVLGKSAALAKTYSVTTWCARHQQQQRQQQQQQQRRRRRRRPSVQAVVAAPPTLPRSDERRRG